MNFIYKLISTIRIKYIVFLAFFVISNSAMAINPKVGAWWSPAESGRGFVLDGSGATLAMQAYTYDSSGKPMWYLAVGQLTNNGANWSGTLEKYSGGQCFGCTYKPNQANGNDGVITIQFTSDTNGILTMPNGMKSNIQSYFPAGTFPSGSTAPTVSVPPSGLSALYGTLTFNYKFDILSYNFTDSVRFTSSNLSSSGDNLTNLLIGSSTKAAGCAIAPIGSNYKYLCVISDTTGTGGKDLFLLNINSSKQISGVYVYCSASSTLSTCSEKLILSPSGTVSGSVLSLASGLDIFPNGNIIPDNNNQKESLIQELKDKSITPSGKTPTDVDLLFDVIEILEKLIK